MRKKLGYSILILGVGAVLAFLISPYNPVGKAPLDRKEKQEVPAVRPTNGLPPDQIAFYATYPITDSGKKIEALEKFVKDFPGSSQIGTARREILKAVVKKWPNDRKRILEAANRMIRPPAETGARTANIPEYQFIAKELLGAGILFDEAEAFAVKSLDGFNRERFVEGMKKMYAGWKREMPSDEVVDKKYIEERAAYRTTLGRIYLKQGKIKAGEKILRETHEASPLLAQAAEGLAEIEEGKGDLPAALNYLTTAALTAGYTTADAHRRFEALYRKTHGGSTEGAEDMLDARYEKLFPNPVKTNGYKPSASRSDRVVLAEFFTGAG